MHADWVAQALEIAREKASGAEVEVYALREKHLTIKVFEGRVDAFNLADYRGIGLRVILDGKCGTAYTEKLDADSLREAVDRAIEGGSIAPVDPYQRIEPPAASRPSPADFVEGEVGGDQVGQKVDLALELEQAARDYDPRIVNVPYASYFEGLKEVRLANSHGFDRSYARAGTGLAVGVMARQGDEVKSPYKVQYTLRPDELDAKGLAVKAAEEGMRRLGATELDSGPCPVIFFHETAQELLGTFSGTFSARSVQKGLSLLAGRLNETIGAPNLTLVDNALLAGGFASRPFDDEGTPSQCVEVIRDGVLLTYFHNQYTARKEGVPSTGHAARGSIKAAVEVAPSNLYLSPGERTLEELMAAAGSGVLIVELDGLHSGANPISGDFSLGAQGYLFDAGGIRCPVHNFTVAGNFFEMLKDIVAVGNDLEFSPPSGGTAVGSPSFLVSRISLSGK